MNFYKKSKFLTGAVLAAAIISMSITSPKKNQPIFEGNGETGLVQEVLPAKIFSSLTIDNDNTKWFITEKGLVSFNGQSWKLHNDNSKISSLNLKGLALETGSDGSKIWIASPDGAAYTSLPIDAAAELKTINPENAPITSKNVISVAVGKSPMRWFGTDKGVDGLKNDKWLTPDYEVLYPENMFVDFPITTMATSPDGDSLYVGTLGAGVTRVFRDDVDGISGASSYAYWGPIIIPSDNVYSIYISPDGMQQWFGTDGGVGHHIGGSTLDNWEAYTTDEGLVDNFVQAITAGRDGKMWFGTKGGISVFDGSEWTTYKTEDGLVSNNILCLGLDKDGVIWIGTDNGVNCYKDGKFESFK